MKEIYLIWDRKLAIVWGATTNKGKAYEEIDKRNSEERTERYAVCVEKDFADK